MRHLTGFLLVVLLIALTPSCKYFKNIKLFGKKKDIVMAEWQAKQDSIRVADSIRRVQERLIAIENARLDSIRLANEQKLALESKYNIIVGSFITPEYARAWADEYRNRGYDVVTTQEAQICYPPQTMLNLSLPLAKVEPFSPTMLNTFPIFGKFSLEISIDSHNSSII